MRRELEGIWRWIARAIALALVGFHLYTGGLGLWPDMEQRSVHVMLALSLTFFLIPGIKRDKPEKKVPIWDILCAIGVVVFCVNYFYKYEWYIENIGDSSAFDIFFPSLSYFVFNLVYDFCYFFCSYWPFFA